MREELIKTSLDAVVLSDTASKRMYDNIIKKFREKKKKTARARIIVPAACAALAAVGVSVTGVILSREKAGTPVDTYGYVTSTVEANGFSGGDGSGGFIAPLSPNTDIVLCGADLTDDEGYGYLCENYGSIKSSLAASGVPVSDMSISEHGYRHIKCESTQDVTQYSVNSGFRDYLIYNGDTLVSIVTVTKNDDGRIGSSISFGADDYYRSFDKFIKQNAGKEIIFLYVGNIEILLTEDYAPFSVTYNASKLFENIRNPFEAFYNEAVVYVP